MHNAFCPKLSLPFKPYRHFGRYCVYCKYSFMFGLLENCKLNKVNFGEYIEDILTRILAGEDVDMSFLPCDYVRRYEDGMDAEMTKPSQSVA